MNGLEWVLVIIVALIFLTVVLTVCVISLTTGFHRTGRMSGGLYCLTAPPGNGKSYVATHLAIEFLKQGRNVFSNYPIVYNNGRERLQTKVLTKDMLLTHNFNGAVLIIDEAHKWFWSRTFKQFTEEYKDWFSTLSQHEISLYYIVQHEDRVDTIINDCANLFGVIEKTEIPFLDMPVCFTITWWNRELDMQFARTNQNIDPFHVERIYFDRDVAQAYDTKWFGTDKRPIYEGIPWITYLKEKMGFEYKGNYNFSLKSQIINRIYEKVINPLGLIYNDMKKKWSEMGKTFDRDEQENTIVSPLAGTEGESPSYKDMPADQDDIDDSRLTELEDGEGGRKYL